MRNMLCTKECITCCDIVCFEYKVNTVRKENLVSELELATEKNFIRANFPEGIVNVKLFYYTWTSGSEDLCLHVFITNVHMCPISSNKNFGFIL